MKPSLLSPTEILFDVVQAAFSTAAIDSDRDWIAPWGVTIGDGVPAVSVTRVSSLDDPLQFVAAFSGPVAADVLRVAQWVTGYRGPNGEWLAPLEWTVV